jgi:tRNA-splicing ligase RtcB (3'-phosphate/5'-hydroxy nucleic acid ligase)
MPQQVAPGLLSWASGIEPGTVEQAACIARLPLVASPVALTADAHVGMDATAGSVIPADGAIIPSAVGVDIGCGMVTTAPDLPVTPAALMPLIEERIPARVGQGSTSRTPPDGSHRGEEGVRNTPVAYLPDHTGAPMAPPSVTVNG